MFFTLFMDDKSKVVELITKEKMWEKGPAQSLKVLANIKSFNIIHIIIENHQDIFKNKVKVINKQGEYKKIINIKKYMKKLDFNINR